MAWKKSYAQMLKNRYVDLSDIPQQNREFNINFSNLAGGLNIWELDYRLKNIESPEMKNLMWRDGVISSRDGQLFVNDTERGVTHSAYETEWHEHKFAHIGTDIYAFSRNNVATKIYAGNSGFTTRGTFFTYNDKMYYKTFGYYIQIVDNGEGFTCADIGTSGFAAYSPVIVINANPESGAGDAYQPENRLSPEKTIWYNPSYKVEATASSNLFLYIEPYTFKSRILTPGTYTFTYNGDDWELDSEVVNLLDYGIQITGTPETDNTIVVSSTDASEYHLPVVGQDIVKVVVDGIELTEPVCTAESSNEELEVDINETGWVEGGLGEGEFVFEYRDEEMGYENPSWYYGENAVDMGDYGVSVVGTPAGADTITVNYVIGGYHYDKDTGVVTFNTAPSYTIPETTNSVQITYTKENSIAYNNIMDCRYAMVYGGTGALCVVMAGSTTQQNAYFWNGQTSIDMDPTYFPVEQYQLAGDVVDPITGFGKQQSYLIIFKQNSVGRTILNTEEINDRLYIDLPYVAINAKIGCDLPWSIQLIDNNLVWANTDQGVHFLQDSSSAYENNIICISTKVNGSKDVRGLLLALRKNDGDLVCSTDDERRYWLCADNKVWVWDYEVSHQKDPSWFYFENIPARAFVFYEDNLWHLDGKGRLTKFADVKMDYGEAIDKVYKFAVQYFGSYDRLKNVNTIEIETRGDSDTETTLEYITDYENRFDLTPLRSYAYHIIPRNLEYRDLTGTGFARVFRRKPFCRHVHHFTMRLRNNIAGQNLSIVGAQVYYNYQGRQR